MSRRTIWNAPKPMKSARGSTLTVTTVSPKRIWSPGSSGTPQKQIGKWPSHKGRWPSTSSRSEEHTSELQSQSNLVCRLLLEKKKHNGLPVTDVDYVVAHHAHLRILEGVAEPSKLPMHTIYLNLAPCGTTPSDSISIALDES